MHHPGKCWNLHVLTSLLYLCVFFVLFVSDKRSLWDFFFSLKQRVWTFLSELLRRIIETAEVFVNIRYSSDLVISFQLWYSKVSPQQTCSSIRKEEDRKNISFNQVINGNFFIFFCRNFNKQTLSLFSLLSYCSHAVKTKLWQGISCIKKIPFCDIDYSVVRKWLW